MKIEDRTDNSVAFGDLVIGECFKFDGRVYRKTVMNAFGNSYSFTSNGDAQFDAKDRVRRVTATLVIE